MACTMSVLSHADSLRILDNFADLTPWQAQHTDDISASLHSAKDSGGNAMRLDFDFADAKGNPVNGYATAHRVLPLDLPDNYEISFRVRGDAPVNTLQFKLIDASGENVWWLNLLRTSLFARLATDPHQETPAGLRLGADDRSRTQAQCGGRVCGEFRSRRRQGLGLLRSTLPARTATCRCFATQAFLKRKFRAERLACFSSDGWRSADRVAQRSGARSAAASRHRFEAGARIRRDRAALAQRRGGDGLRRAAIH